MTRLEAIAPWLMQALILDFDLSPIQAAAIAGNLAYETGGFQYLQEINPAVAGSAGGFGWAQWTGPRRQAFEAYCKRNNLDPRSDMANYKFLWVELDGPEKAALYDLRLSQTIENATITFERRYERAGVKAYPRRIEYAQRARALWRKQRPWAVPPFVG